MGSSGHSCTFTPPLPATPDNFFKLLDKSINPNYMENEAKDPGITWDNKEQEVINENDKVLNEVEKQMVEVMSAQDWGQSFIKVKVLAPLDVKEKLDKLSEEQKEDLDTLVNGLLRNIEAFLS